MEHSPGNVRSLTAVDCRDVFREMALLMSLRHSPGNVQISRRTFSCLMPLR
jgi:hypothetical protein